MLSSCCLSYVSFIICHLFLVYALHLSFCIFWLVLCTRLHLSAIFYNGYSSTVMCSVLSSFHIFILQSFSLIILVFFGLHFVIIFFFSFPSVFGLFFSYFIQLINFISSNIRALCASHSRDVCYEIWSGSSSV